jgi:D-serine dehydratase
LSRPTKGLLRSGCYVTHDDGFYKRLGHLVNTRLGSQSFSRTSCSAGLQAALEVWCVVQSRPEPHLAILNAGKRDLSCDMGLPVAVRWAPAGHTQPEEAPPTWHITQLNDQHAYLVMDAADDGTPVLQVGDRVALGISHPCTTFDKWRWMPLVSDTGDIQGAISTHF